MKIDMIVAVARNGVIGRDGGIPWRLPEDMRYFKKVTTGAPIIMGRLTWESIGRPLPGRENIVVSSTMTAAPDGVVLCTCLQDAIEHCAVTGADRASIMGGARIYQEGLAVADRLYITELDADYEGDTFFPTIDTTLWTETSRRPAQEAGPDDPPYDFVIYERA
jgi:dihydrofolate reductase